MLQTPFRLTIPKGRRFSAGRFFGWLSFLLTTLPVSVAQPPTLRFEHDWGQPPMLGAPTVMMQDRKGLLWFGFSNNGLAKYDGHRFTYYRFDPQDSTSLSHHAFGAIWEDNTGSIWVGPGMATCRFDPHTETFTRLERSPANPFAFNFARAFSQDRDGRLWVGNQLGELRVVDRTTGRFSATDYASLLGVISDSSSIFKQQIRVIHRDKAGTLWIGSLTGLHQLKLTPPGKGQPSKVSFTHYRYNPADTNSLSHNSVFSIYEDRKGVLWVGTQGGGLHAFNRTTGRFTRYQHDPNQPESISSNVVNGIAEDPQGNLWVATDRGLNRLNPQRTQMTRYVHDPLDPYSLRSNRIGSLLMDQSGMLWVSTNAGIDKLDTQQKPFALYQHQPANPHSLSDNRVNALLEDAGGTVWIGTLGGGLNAWDRKRNLFTQYRHDAMNAHSLVSDSVGALLEDRDKNLWIANGKVLSRLDRKTGKFIHTRLSHPFNSGFVTPHVFALCQDKAGLIWLGTTNGIIGFDPKTATTRSYTHTPNRAEGISDWWTYAVLEDKRGHLWIGHGSQALDILDRKTGKFTHYRHDSRKPHSLSSDAVVTIYEDAQGNLWFGTLNGGLCRFDAKTETFTAYTEKHGLAGNNIYSILEDNQGNLWMGTNQGLSKFSPQKNTFTNYDVNDGLQGDIFTTHSIGACYKGRDGMLYFGGKNGFNAFDPVSVRPNAFVPPVVITQFNLFDKPQPGQQEAARIELDYDENFFSLEFAVLNFRSPHKNQYAYQLEGVDKDWVYSGTRHVSAYTGVGPGEYVFRVKGANNDGVWNEQGTSIRIHILPPWWRTWWAYGFYGLLVLAGLFALDRYQRRRLIQAEREKARERELVQARQIEKANKDLEQQKVALQSTLEDLKSTQTQLIQKEKMASLGELTAGIAHEIQNPLNFVNNFSEVSTELVGELQEGPFHKLPTSEKEYAAEILSDLTQNLQKITLHGQRASSIVKGMLEHSRTTTGEKQPTDLNALVEEYLRLAYQGVRAKDNSFSANLNTELDPKLGQVEVVPQEIGRVLLNLFNNAFYAVSEKKRQQSNGYEPTVTVSTKRIDEGIEITIGDNGTGMPESVKQKIFQPFFTTKPTGQGTGLGLSLSYDIVTKGHGGGLTVKSQEGQGSTFTMALPE